MILLLSPSRLLFNHRQDTKRLEQPQRGLGCLGRNAESRYPQCLTGLQHQHVCPFFVHVGVGQIVRAAIQDIDQFHGKILPGSYDGQS